MFSKSQFFLDGIKTFKKKKKKAASEKARSRKASGDGAAGTRWQRCSAAGAAPAPRHCAAFPAGPSAPLPAPCSGRGPAGTAEVAALFVKRPCVCLRCLKLASPSWTCSVQGGKANCSIQVVMRSLLRPLRSQRDYSEASEISLRCKLKRIQSRGERAPAGWKIPSFPRALLLSGEENKPEQVHQSTYVP